jgi:hypothetical protein
MRRVPFPQHSKPERTGPVAAHARGREPDGRG